MSDGGPYPLYIAKESMSFFPACNSSMATRQTSAVAKKADTVRYRPPNIPIGAIRRYARLIADRFQPDKIVLFGSYAYGRPHPESDVDLLVVMPAADETNQAIRITLAFERPFPLDLIVRTPQNLRRRLADGNWFLREVMEKGTVLSEQGNRAVDPKGRRGFRRRQKSGSRSADS
jgi:predicted nucleotidyltransferase